MKKHVWVKMEALEHSKENGFYDSEVDMYFEDLGEWLKCHGYGWQDIM